MKHALGDPCPVCGGGSLYKLRVCGPCWSVVPPRDKRRLASHGFGTPAFEAELERLIERQRSALHARGA